MIAPSLSGVQQPREHRPRLLSLSRLREVEAPLGRTPFLLTLIAVLLLLNAYPLYQLSTTGGYLFYTNAYDEASYLDYDFSGAAQRPSRSGQYLVTLAHRAGMSGGWINLVFDVAASVAFVLLGRRVLSGVGFGARQARLGALLIMLFPLLFGGLNPFIRRLFDSNLSSGLIYWVTVPEASTLPVLRSPEPQFSLVLLGVSLYAAVKYRSFAPAYLCMPFLYPFITVPFAFVVLAVHMRVRMPWAGNHPAVPPLLSFAIVSIALWIYFGVYLDDGARRLLVESRYPLVSFTSALGLVLYLLAFKCIPEHLRYAALMIGLSPLAAANQQVVTGWLAQPNNVEQSFGISGLAVVSALWAIRGAWAGRVAGLLAGAAVALSAYTTWADNYATNRVLTVNEEMLRLLRADSGNVMINDIALASRASMLFPRQASTLLAYQHTFPGRAEKNLVPYVCAREATRRDSSLERGFRRVFMELDRGYRHENLDFILLHVGRKRTFTVEHELEQLPYRCPAAELHYVIVKHR